MFYILKSKLRCLRTMCNNVNPFSFNNIFSTENRQSCMKKFLANTAPLNSGRGKKIPRKAAVLIPLCIHKHEVSLLYTLRSSNLNTHRGQVSFPGGMFDEGDLSLVDTALRETQEELGIPANAFEVWGSGNLVGIRNDITVLPVIGFLKAPLNLDALILNKSEVEEVFAVRLADLCDPSQMRHTQFKNKFSTPVYLGAQRRIWGITAVITHTFLKSLLPADTYNHYLPYISNVSKL